MGFPNGDVVLGASLKILITRLSCFRKIIHVTEKITDTYHKIHKVTIREKWSHGQRKNFMKYLPMVP